VNAMRMAKPHMFVYELEAILHHAFRVHGSGRPGYSSIVASGPNACVLHYVQNDRRMNGRDLLLIDAGAEFDYYTADITRVSPVGGTFTEPQKEVYQAVLTAQKEGIRLARPGKTMQAIHQTTVEVLVEELKRLKVLKGPTKKLIETKAYQPFYPHGTGHWLGMDVHDIGTYYVERYHNYRKFEPGHVLTIEPGLYFSPDAPGPARYKGIGVRIEDDILITANGCKVLTVKAPKEIEEVESLCSR
jgi:Xaa-Pro aminopeptidase